MLKVESESVCVYLQCDLWSDGVRPVSALPSAVISLPLHPFAQSLPVSPSLSVRSGQHAWLAQYQGKQNNIHIQTTCGNCMCEIFYWQKTRICLICYPAIVYTQCLGKVWRHTPGVTKCPDKRGRSLRITSVPCNLDQRWYFRKISSDISSQRCVLILLRVSEIFHFSCHMTFNKINVCTWHK